MSMVFVLLPLSIILGGGALVLFLWALRNGQFDDLDIENAQGSMLPDKSSVT